MGIKHAKVSAKADGGDATKIRPSDWNEGHTITEIVASAQAAIFASAATSNSPDDGSVGQDTGSFAVHNLMQFSLTGVTSVTAAWLEFVTLNWNNCIGVNEGANASIKVYRMLRTDINYSQVTHNVYKTGSNWTTAGATGSSDRSATGIGFLGPFPNAASVTLGTGATVDRRKVDITEVVRAAIEGAQANLDLMLVASLTGGQNAFVTASRTDSTVVYRPKIIIL